MHRIETETQTETETVLINKYYPIKKRSNCVRRSHVMKSSASTIGQLKKQVKAWSVVQLPQLLLMCCR